MQDPQVEWMSEGAASIVSAAPRGALTIFQTLQTKKGLYLLLVADGSFVGPRFTLRTCSGLNVSIGGLWFLPPRIAEARIARA